VNANDIGRILDDHRAAFQALEDQVIYAIGNRYGTASAKAAIRAYTPLLIGWILTTQNEADNLDLDVWLGELAKNEGSLYHPVLAPDPHRLVDCPNCDNTTIINRAGTCDTCARTVTGEEQ
jgi:predicted neutral ceramidase superfamily lipid hydrolase